MHTYPHDFNRLVHRGCLGWERRHRQERREKLYQLAACLLLSVALVTVYWAVSGI